MDVRLSRVSIRAIGALDLAAADDLAGLLASEVAAGRVFIRMDLSRVSSLDSSCVGALEHAHDGCLASEGFLLLEGISGWSRDGSAGLEEQLFCGRRPGPSQWTPELPGLVDLVQHARDGATVL